MQFWLSWILLANVIAVCQLLIGSSRNTAAIVSIYWYHAFAYKKSEEKFQVVEFLFRDTRKSYSVHLSTSIPLRDKKGSVTLFGEKRHGYFQGQTEGGLGQTIGEGWVNDWRLRLRARVLVGEHGKLLEWLRQQGCSARLTEHRAGFWNGAHSAQWSFAKPACSPRRGEWGWA